MDQAPVEYRFLDSYIDKLLAEWPREEISGHEKSDHEKSGSEKSGSEKSSSEKSSRDSSIRDPETEDSSAIEARSDASAWDEFDSFDDHVTAPVVRDPVPTTSSGKADASEDESSSATPIRKRKPTSREKKNLAAVVLSFPLRATLCAFHLPIIAFDQIATSIGRAVRKDKSASVVQWPKLDKALPADVYKKHGRSMILYNLADDPGGTIFEQVHITGRNRKVRDEDITRFDSSPTFKDLGMDGRLDIIAHGDADEVGDCDPIALATWLDIKKLKRVGVLNVDSCSVGAGSYLEELGNELHRRGIKFGWIAGSREKTRDQRRPLTLGEKRYSFSIRPYPWKRDTEYRPASLNRKILKGNKKVSFPETVFDHKKPAWRVASSYSPLR